MTDGTNDGPASQWTKNPNSFLWLHGFHGCNKIFQTSTVIGNTMQYHVLSENTTVAYFCFDSSDGKNQEYEKTLRSVIVYLSMRSINTPDALDLDMPLSINKAYEETAFTLGIDLWHMIRDIFPDSYKHDVSSMAVEAFRTLSGQRTGKLHVLVTSWRESHADEPVNPLNNSQKETCIRGVLVNDNIGSYIHERPGADLMLREKQKTTIGHFTQYDPNPLIANTCIARSLQSYFSPVCNQCASVLLSRDLTTKKGQPHPVTVPSVEQSPKMVCRLCTMILHKLSPVDLGSRSAAVTVMGTLEVQTNPDIYSNMHHNTLMIKASSGLSNPFWVRLVSVSRLHIQDVMLRLVVNPL